LGAEDNEDGQKLNHFVRVENAYAEIKSLLTMDYPKGKNLSQDKVNVENAGSNSKCKNSGNLDAKLKEPVFRGVEV
jgi:hypothetical protein